MGLFGFFNRSKFLKMSAQEKAREQGYAYLLCIEYAAVSNKTEKGNDKVSDEDLKILSIASEAINIGYEYLNCELRKSKFFDDSKDGNHFKEVLSSFDLKTKRSAIKQMLIVYSNREKLENLLDENGNYILKGKYMTPIERISFLMGINEELEDIVKNLIYELNKDEFRDHELSNSENDLTKLFSHKQRLAVLEMIVLIGSINELSDEQNNIIIDIASTFQIEPDSDVSLTEFERSNLLKDLKIEQSNYINYIIHKMIELDKISSIDSQKIYDILSDYAIDESIINNLSNNLDNKSEEAKLKFYESGIEKNANSEYEEAIIDFTKAIEIDGEFIDAYRSRASSRIWINDYEGVVNDNTKIIELNSEDSYAYECRGRAKAILKDYYGAIEDFSKAIELDKESKVYSSRGRMKKNLLDYNGAMLDYNIAVEKYPEDESSYFGRGELKYVMEDYLGAIIDFNKCIEIKPNRIIFIDKRADCRLKIEDYIGAIEDYSMSIQNRQDKFSVDRPPSENATKLLASLYYNRGFARYKIKEYNKAIEDLKKAIEINPDFEEAIKLLETLI